MSAGLFELVIGDKNWSTWSFRPWILMKVASIPFDEVHIRLRQDDTKAQILAHSPSGQVPALKWRGEVIADSLAICETLADLYPERSLWPADLLARAHARSAATQMHSGFVDLRRDMPMDALARAPGEGHTELALAAARRVVDIWRDARIKFGRKAPNDHGFLFGTFSIADAMFAPVVSRFQTYNVDLSSLGDSDDPSGIAQTYMQTMLTLPAFVEWTEGAKAEMAERA
ncbi:MAG: glutathione S-transferase family protein [Parvibaculum sp.]|nr:glutathione S-transferase family protein [Parvibaculum sp.]